MKGNALKKFRGKMLYIGLSTEIYYANEFPKTPQHLHPNCCTPRPEHCLNPYHPVEP